MRIAHISDLHILEPRAGRSLSGYDVRTRFLSFGRRLDAAARSKKLVRALRAAWRIGARQVVVSSDLTESGSRAQFDELARALHEGGGDPECVTLVPGNHDAYGEERAWERALDGPLRAYAKSSAGAPGKVVDRGDVCILPLDVAFTQPVTRSAGRITRDAADAVHRRAADASFGDRAVVVVQHHPPYARKTTAVQWVDGLEGCAHWMALLAASRVQVLHGHLHRVSDRTLDDARAENGGTPTRFFGAPAMVEDPEGAPRLRVYDARDGALESAGLVDA